MFERFTEPARQVVAGAQEEARRLHHHHIGTEHLLLALLEREDDTGPLTTLDVTKPEAEDRIVAALRRVAG